MVGFACQTVSSPRFIPGFGKACSELAKSQSRKRGKIELTLGIWTRCFFIHLLVKLLLICCYDVIVASTALGKPGPSASSKKRRQVRVKTANLKVAQLTVSDNNKVFLLQLRMGGVLSSPVGLVCRFCRLCCPRNFWNQ